MGARVSKLTFFFLLIGVFIPSLVYAQENPNCAGYTMDRIVAAFNTQGYWMLDDLMDQFANHHLDLWAPVIYIFVVVGGLICAAMGLPPKQWIWYVFGPVLFNFLMYTTSKPSDGVCWYIGASEEAAHSREQKEVWKLAEVGLINQNRAYKDSIEYHRETAPTGSEARQLPMVFLGFDQVMSAQVGFFVDWAGMNKEVKNKNDQCMHEDPNNGGKPSGDGVDPNPWTIMSNLKWPLLEDVTAATLKNADLKDALSRFMASECGDEFARHVDKGAWTAAGSSRGMKMPKSLFSGSGDPNDAEAGNIYDHYGVNMVGIYNLKRDLAKIWLPYPDEIKRLLRDSGSSSDFAKFRPVRKYAQKRDESVSLNCAQYLHIIVEGFRWETGYQYNQMVARAGVKAQDVNYTMTYGWTVKELEKSQATGGGAPKCISMKVDEQRHFIQDMILMHLIRNEMFTVSFPVDRSYTSSERVENYTKANAATVGSKNKYGELYMWAKLMPYIQGVALYFLCGVYPFACLLMIIPGWHKALLSWACFYTWARSWDAGFAVVQSLERNIWGMLGSSGDTTSINSRIFAMQKLGDISITQCGDENDLRDCLKPVVIDADDHDVASALGTFDIGLLLSGRLDYDTSNAYYVYLMSALFFAVPAVTGQLMLSARAGIAGMLTEGINGAASEAGRGAGMGYLGDAATRAANSQAVIAQEGFAKSLRGDKRDGDNVSLMQSALNFANTQATSSMKSGMYQHLAGQTGNLLGMQKEDVKTHGYVLGRAFGLFGGGGKNGGAPGADANRVGASSGLFGMVRSMTAGVAGQVPKILKEMPDAGFQYFGNRIGLTGGNKIAQLNNQANGFSADAESADVMNRRYGSLAGFQAQDKAWLARRNAGLQMAGRMSAIGAFHASFGAGDKPTDLMGMAGMGMMNTFKTVTKTDENGITHTYRVGSNYQERFMVPALEAAKNERKREADSILNTTSSFADIALINNNILGTGMKALPMTLGSMYTSENDNGDSFKLNPDGTLAPMTQEDWDVVNERVQQFRNLAGSLPEEGQGNNEGK